MLTSEWRDLPQRRADDALDRGYSPAPEDFRPLPKSEFSLDELAEAWRADIAAVRSCSVPTCRTSLTDDSAIYCDHGRAFCVLCPWHDGCSACDEAGIA